MKASSQEPEAVAYCDLNIELLCSISPEIANLISICPNSKRDLQTTLMLLTSLQITLETLRNHPYLHQDDSPSPLVADSLPPILDKTQKALARVSAILDSHQKGDHGGEWQDSEHKSVTSLNRFLDGSMEALNLALDVFSL